MTQEKTSDGHQERKLNTWSPLLLSTGFHLEDLVRTALTMCDTPVQRLAVQNVLRLLEAGCTDEHEFRDAIAALSELCRTHPERNQSSGGWYSGPASLLAMGVAQEAATSARCSLYPSIHTNGEIEGSAFKAFKYLLDAMAQSQNQAMPGLKWLSGALNQRFAPTTGS